MSTDADTFYCAECGTDHPGPPMSYGADYPDPYFSIPEEERQRRCVAASDQCIVDEHRFVRGNIELPVTDGAEPFVWSVWVSLSQSNFERMDGLWNTEGRETEPAYFGWLCTRLPFYPDTLSMKTLVHTRPVGERPLIELEPTDHPLAVEQREGITMERVRQIAHLMDTDEANG